MCKVKRHRVVNCMPCKFVQLQNLKCKNSNWIEFGN